MNNYKKIAVIFVLLSFMFINIDIKAACSYESALQTYGPYATESMKQTGVYASLTLAQGIIEQSLKTGNSNNMFGIKVTGVKTLPLSTEQTELDKEGAKCKSKGGTWVQTKEYSKTLGTYSAMACFKAYSSPSESFADHGRWLLNDFANRNEFKAATNLEGQLKSLVSNPNARYATSQNYLCNLISVINSCDLTRFDEGVSGNGQTGVHISNLSSEGCSSVSSDFPSSISENEHFETSYTGDLTKGWIYERFEFQEIYNKNVPEHKIESNINDVIDEIFDRAKTSYHSSYYSSSDSGASYGYSAQACSELEDKTGFGSSDTWRQGYDLWKNIPVGSGNLGQIGCLVTSIAIQLDRMGTDTGINNFNPGTFACYLSKNGKFTADGLLAGNWNDLFPNVSLSTGKVNGSKSDQASQIQSLINQGCYLVLYAPHSGNSHFVAVSGTSGDNINIIDPGAGYTKLWGNIYDFNSSTSYRCLKAS